MRMSKMTKELSQARFQIQQRLQPVVSKILPINKRIETPNRPASPHHNLPKIDGVDLRTVKSENGRIGIVTSEKAWRKGIGQGFMVQVGFVAKDLVEIR